MPLYHEEVKNICRTNKKGNSISKVAGYICGRNLFDSFKGKKCYCKRNDVDFCKVFLPENAPPEYGDLQTLCNSINKSETRCNSRTGRHFILSLPNELSIEDQINIVCEFTERNFISNGLCVIAAIHSGMNKTDPSKNNPHAHLIVSTRTIDAKGFNAKKDREHNKTKYITVWRKEWEKEVNRAYERNSLNIRVSHESLEVQGINDREPICHLSQADWQKEQRGIRTYAGNRKRAIEKRNRELRLKREREREQEREHELDMELSR